MPLTMVWSFLEYWAEYPPANEVLRSISIGLGAKYDSPAKKISDAKAADEAPSSVDAWQFASIAGPVIPINHAPRYLREHLAKLNAMATGKEGKVHAG